MQFKNHIRLSTIHICHNRITYTPRTTSYSIAHTNTQTWVPILYIHNLNIMLHTTQASASHTHKHLSYIKTSTSQQLKRPAPIYNVGIYITHTWLSITHTSIHLSHTRVSISNTYNTHGWASMPHTTWPSTSHTTWVPISLTHTMPRIQESHTRASISHTQNKYLSHTHNTNFHHTHKWTSASHMWE